MSRILVGSCYFFSGYSDFIPGDIDETELLEKFRCHRRHVIGEGFDIFQLKYYQSWEECVYWDLYYGRPIVVASYIVPEFCEAIGFPFEALPQLQPLIDNLSKRYAYIKVIYESYLENGSFTLTTAQRLKAYEIYKQARPERYSQQFN
jgi:hypothetical protein